MTHWLERTELLLGSEKTKRLQNARVLVVGLGGVGAYAAKMLARSGIGALTIVDADDVSETNINRQLVALHSTVGRPKAEILAARLQDINPQLRLTVLREYVRDEATDRLARRRKVRLRGRCDRYAVAESKSDQGALDRGIPLVSSMGAGAKTDPTLIEIRTLRNRITVRWRTCCEKKIA